jgi:hypothetical protein
MKTPYKYRIVITSEREDYDDLSQYADNPESGFIEAIHWFDYLWQIEGLLCKYEGLFYILSVVENNNAELNLISSRAKNVIGYGVIEGIGGYPSIDIYEYERKEYEQRSDD